MQTSISSIPINQQSSSMSMDDDPDVDSVIQEMNNMSSSQKEPDQQAIMQQRQMQQQQQQLQQMQQQQQLQQMQQQLQNQNKVNNFQLPGQPLGSSLLKNNLIDKVLIQRALASAFVAFVVFYPADLNFLYEKYTYLNYLSPYERIVRALLLALFLYILFLKLNI